MISLYKLERTSLKSNGGYSLVELRGLSTDTKPTQLDDTYIENGSAFIEIDTGKVYLYDLESQSWKEV